MFYLRHKNSCSCLFKCGPSVGKVMTGGHHLYQRSALKGADFYVYLQLPVKKRRKRFRQMSHLMTKPTKWLCAQRRLRSACLGIRPVWSESSLCAQWVAKNPSFLHADSELWSDWMDAQADPSLCWAHMPLCWFYHEVAHGWAKASLRHRIN